jgi:hypothetical protein
MAEASFWYWEFGFDFIFETSGGMDFELWFMSSYHFIYLFFSY